MSKTRIIIVGPYSEGLTQAAKMLSDKKTEVVQLDVPEAKAPTMPIQDVRQLVLAPEPIVIAEVEEELRSKTVKGFRNNLGKISPRDQRRMSKFRRK